MKKTSNKDLPLGTTNKIKRKNPDMENSPQHDALRPKKFNKIIDKI